MPYAVVHYTRICVLSIQTFVCIDKTRIREYCFRDKTFSAFNRNNNEIQEGIDFLSQFLINNLSHEDRNNMIIFNFLLTNDYYTIVMKKFKIFKSIRLYNNDLVYIH